MQNKADIEKALKQLKENETKYLKTERYYRGDHDLAFASEKFKNAFGSLFREFSLNLCPAICDAVRDKLKIKNFKVEKGQESVAEEAWKIWQQNRMGVRSGEVHKEALKNGDAYVIVWVDPLKRITIYPQKASTCTVSYDEEIPGKIFWAAKTWKLADKRARVNLYYADRTERYVSKKKIETGVPDFKDLIEFAEDGFSADIPNKYATVPVFHFANNSDIGTPGQSELLAAMPVQDAYNKTILDMLVAMEFVSYPQRFAAGIEIDYDDDGNPIPPFKSGIDRLWYTENDNAKFGSLEVGDLEQFLKVKADFRIDLASVTGTPLYYFTLTSGDVPSGESLKKLETRFVNKVRDRQESFGQVWEDVFAFASKFDGNKDVRLFTDWEDPAPLSETEKLNNILLKQEIGISDEQALIEAGYGEADIAKMLTARAAKAAAAVNRFNAGEELPEEE